MSLEREQALDERERVLDERERALDERERALDERERALDEREDDDERDVDVRLLDPQGGVQLLGLDTLFDLKSLLRLRLGKRGGSMRIDGGFAADGRFPRSQIMVQWQDLAAATAAGWGDERVGWYDVIIDGYKYGPDTTPGCYSDPTYVARLLDAARDSAPFQPFAAPDPTPMTRWVRGRHTNIIDIQFLW